MLLDEILEKLSEKCKEVLTAKFYNGLSASQIADKFGYSSQGAARGANHDCLKKAREQGKIECDKLFINV